MLGLFFLWQPAKAYVDPGSGGPIFSSLAVILPAILSFFALLFRPLKRLFLYLVRSLKKMKKPKNQ
jgi:hypothetical protein